MVALSPFRDQDISLSIEDFSHLGHEGVGRKRFLEEMGLSSRRLALGDRVACVAGDKEDPEARGFFQKTRGQLPTVHLGHYDVGDHEINWRAVPREEIDRLVPS